ncbi:MAG: S-layer homology domain-containing protein [Oscillospiraceae bacterium]|nr:S-layer homology domain-containing protein [Oscillospiraceae bacterium]
MSKRFLALILCLCLLFSHAEILVCAVDYPENNENEPLLSRFTVLVLDVSGSMQGTPLSLEKQAAIKFCESLFASSGNNKIALVVYESSVSVLCSFTDDLDKIKNAINSMHTGGTTNIEGALRKADELLQTVEGTVENIVLLSDGVPCKGETQKEGPYSVNDSEYYEYANAVYNIAQYLKPIYNIYSLGFFHSLSGDQLEFAKSIMANIQNNGNYIVTNVDDLTFLFGNIAETITQAQLKDIYINQHVAYYQGDFENEIQEIELPDRNGIVSKGTTYYLGNIVNDALEDGTVVRYSAAKFFDILLSTRLKLDLHSDDIISFQNNYLENLTSTYDLILADIVTSDYYKDIVEETCRITIQHDTVNLLSAFVDAGPEILKEIAKKPDSASLYDMEEAWQTLAETLDQMRITDDPGEFASLYGKCSIIVNEYVEGKKAKEFWKNLSKKAEGKSGKIIQSLLGAGLNTASEMIDYYSCYDAYCEASETFKETLTAIKTISALRGKNGTFYRLLEESIDNFLINATDEATSASSVASRFVSVGIDALNDSFFQMFLDALFEMIPIVRDLHKIKKIAQLGTSGLLLLTDLTTTWDDQANLAYLLYHLYYLTNCTAEAADSLGTALTHSQDNGISAELRFRLANWFDEAIRIWRCCAMMMCDIGIQYEELLLMGAHKDLHPMFPLQQGLMKPIIQDWAMKQASWSSTLLSLAALDKMRISNIRCHDSDVFQYVPTKDINLSDNAQVVMIACPVTVTVTDEKGNRIAVLSDQSQTIKEGYEPYFHVVKTNPDSDDYMKVCYIPSTWNVQYSGTASGDMYVIQADISDGAIQTYKASNLLPVKVGESGNVEDIVTEIKVSNQIAGPFRDILRSAYYYDAVLWAVENGITSGTSATTFSPDATCTRAQMVTFLWRTAGCPVVQRTNPFVDVRSDAYYYNAVLWAVKNGITAGTSAARFSPEDTVTRDQAVTFLYRFAGSPDVSGGNAFRDVPGDAYYASAVQWAVSKQVTNGTGATTFSPGAPCTRAQTVTFLYRMQRLGVETTSAEGQSADDGKYGKITIGGHTVYIEFRDT